MNDDRTNENFRPDFIQIPTAVAFDKDLQPLDRMVYGIVYWFEKLKNGHCYASNKTIAKFVLSSSSGVANSLSRLREAGYIACIYGDKGNRKEIKTLVFNTVNPYSNEEGGVTQMSNIIKNNKNNISSETQKQLEDLYTGYIIKFRVDPDDWAYADSTERREDLINQAKKNYRLTPKRKEKLLTRINDAGYEMTKSAIINCSESPWHRGDDPKSNGWFAHLDWICASYERIEDWATRNG